MIQTAKMPYVRFETEVITTKDAYGHNVYTNNIMAYITSAGSKDEFVKDANEWVSSLLDKAQNRGAFDAAANEYEQWHHRFSKMLDQYKAGANLDMEGTPLRASMAFSPAEIAQCENVKIFTIETLAVCNEEAISRMGMGGRVLKQKAEKMLGSVDSSKLAEENAALRLKVEELTKSVQKLTELVGSGNNAEPAKRGRKPKQD